MIKETENHLLQELDSTLAKQGKSFDSAVREYRAAIVDEIAADDEKEDAKWIAKYKKYRSRIGADIKAKPYIELQKMLSYFKEQNIIKPAPLLHLVDDDVFSDNLVEKLSKMIRNDIK